MNNDESNGFKYSMTEWRGYVVRALEDVDKSIKIISDQQKEISIKIDELKDKFNNEMTNTRIKVATLGGASGVITALITLLISIALRG